LAYILKHLKALHETSNKGRAFFLTNMLFSITMDESASLHEDLLKSRHITEKWFTIGWKMDEEDMVVIIVKILPLAYEHFIETLNITTMNVDQIFDELCNIILQHDIEKK
jgi:hypothetical protein